jgi:hypothetical protein
MTLPPAGGRFRDGSKRGERSMVLRATECRQAAHQKRDVIETGVRVLVQVAADPAGARAAVALRILACDQGDELEQLAERRPGDLTERGFGDEEVAVLTGSLEDRSRMTGRQGCLSGVGAARRD